MSNPLSLLHVTTRGQQGAAALLPALASLQALATAMSMITQSSRPDSSHLIVVNAFQMLESFVLPGW